MKHFWVTPIEMNWGYKAPKISVVATDRIQAVILAKKLSGLGRFDNWKFT